MMTCLRSPKVQVALVCTAIVLQGCMQSIANAAGETLNAIYTTTQCATGIEMELLPLKNKTLELLVGVCDGTQFEVTSDSGTVEALKEQCTIQGTKLLGVAFTCLKVNATATCVHYVADIQNVMEREHFKNTSQIPEEVATWIAATKNENLKLFEALVKFALDFAKDPKLDYESAAKLLMAYSGKVTPESKKFSEANQEVLGEFAMLGGNKIQAMTTSHAGRWVACAGSIVMVVAGVFRFSRRASLTPSSTKTDSEKLVSDADIEGRCEQSAE